MVLCVCNFGYYDVMFYMLYERFDDFIEVFYVDLLSLGWFCILNEDLEFVNRFFFGIWCGFVGDMKVEFECVCFEIVVLLYF